MANTYHQIYLQTVFAVKYRKAVIDKAWASQLFGVIGNLINEANCKTLIVNGVEDHVHLLIGLKPTHCISDFMRELKKESSAWIHETIGQKEFAWQDGYAIFSISATARPNVKSYIANQREHHRVKSFTEELTEMLEKAGVEYDPKYLE